MNILLHSYTPLIDLSRQRTQISAVLIFCCTMWTGVFSTDELQWLSVCFDEEMFLERIFRFQIKNQNIGKNEIRSQRNRKSGKELKYRDFPNFPDFFQRVMYT